MKPGKYALIMLAAWCAGCAAPATQSASTAIAPTALVVASATIPVSPVANTQALNPTLPPAPRTFTEQFDTQPPYWDFLQIDNGQILAAPNARDGFLVFTLPGPDQWAYVLYEGQGYTDVMVEADVQNRSGGDGAAGLVCRYDQQKGWYELNVYEDQTYQLLFGQWLASGVARYTPLFRGQSAAIKSDDNQIGLHCQGTALTPFINGTQMRTWQELKYGLQAGKVGLAASSFTETPFTIAFDWVKLGEP